MCFGAGAGGGGTGGGDGGGDAGIYGGAGKKGKGKGQFSKSKSTSKGIYGGKGKGKVNRFVVCPGGTSRTGQPIGPKTVTTTFTQTSTPATKSAPATKFSKQWGPKLATLYSHPIVGKHWSGMMLGTLGMALTSTAGYTSDSGPSLGGVAGDDKLMATDDERSRPSILNQPGTPKKKLRCVNNGIISS